MTTSIPERHQHILNKLREQGHVSVLSLSQELNVTTVTIRKDLKYLEERKFLFRSHGSATPNNPYINERPVNEKEKIRVSQKQRIARAAADLIESEDSIIIASGTTVIELARQIKAHSKLTVVTASLNAALILSRDPVIDIIQLGGALRKNSSSVIGHYAMNMLEELSCNKLFLGVDGIDPEFGLTTTNNMEAALNKLMIKSAQRVIVLADSTKFGRRGFSKICNLSEIEMVITDDEVPESFVEKLDEAGVECVRV